MTDPRVTGALRYSQDVAMEGMLHARLLRSPVAHARVVGVDASAVPEGIIVLLPQDVRDLGGYGPQIKDQEVFPQERVRYAEEIEPLSDSRGSARYRRRVIAVEVRRALEDLNHD
jgi:CO/xanthine dehydrogenase Mo-binding subunit